jgi:regulator of ribonuclease activity A
MSTESLEEPKLEFKATCDVCDAYGNRALVPGGIQWKMYGAKQKYCGYAVTVKCIDDNTWVKDIIESTIGSGKVLVIDAGKSTRCAVIGDRVAAKAFENKWEGIVIYGCVRDVEGLSQLDIGIHAIGNVPNKSIPTGKMVGYAGEPISMDDITVSSGDMVYADMDGVVFIKSGEECLSS